MQTKIYTHIAINKAGKPVAFKMPEFTHIPDGCYLCQNLISGAIEAGVEFRMDMNLMLLTSSVTSDLKPGQPIPIPDGYLIEVVKESTDRVKLNQATEGAVISEYAILRPSSEGAVVLEDKFARAAYLLKQEFVAEYSANREKHGMLQSLELLFDKYFSSYQSKIEELEKEGNSWICEEHPQFEMGHDGCSGAGALKKAQVHLLSLKLRLSEQSFRELKSQSGFETIQLADRIKILEDKLQQANNDKSRMQSTIDELQATIQAYRQHNPKEH